MRRQRIAEKWGQFARLVLPKECSALQRQEMRRAFYGGVEGLLQAILLGLTPGSEPEAADLTMMDDIQSELADFAERLKNGTA